MDFRDRVTVSRSLVRHFALALAVGSPALAFASSVDFASKVTAGSSTVYVNADNPSSVTVYQFDSGYTPTPASDSCSSSDLASGTILTVVAGSGTQQTAQTATTIGAAAPQTITLSAPLVAGTQLCLVELPNGSSTPVFSKFQTVVNPLDFGRFQMGFTGGVMISNEEQSSGSSTASEYADVGLAYSWARGKVRRPGFTSFLNTRLTSLPVSTSTTTTTAGSSAASPTISQALNVLTSQQSARILIGAFAPIQTTRFLKRSNAFTLAPLVKAGFDTLLNPSVGSSSGSSTNAPISVTQANFSSVYYLLAGGMRAGWETYPTSTDKAPESNAWLSFVIGDYSNLPSYACSNSKFYASTAKPTTACKTVAVTSGSTATYDVYASRRLVPRIEIAGEARIPNYPFVLGLDANLSQYSFWLGSNKIDTLNKAGNDVRFYIGYTLDLASAFKKLGVSQ